MAYTGDLSQRKQLVDALNELRARRFPFPTLAQEISAAAKNDEHFKYTSTRMKQGGITRQTIEKYMTSDPNKMWAFEHPCLIYEFLSRSKKYATEAIPYEEAESVAPSRVIEIISNYFSTKDSLRYERFYGLEGQYAMFRRLWSSPSDVHFIRSIVSISREGKWLTYREVQNYVDPISTTPISEVDTGYLFVFERNIFILSREQSEKSMKFLVIHDFKPYINENDKIDIFAGNLIGVGGPGPHPGFRFICRRIKEVDGFESRVLTIDELDITCSKYFASDGKIHI